MKDRVWGVRVTEAGRAWKEAAAAARLPHAPGQLARDEVPDVV